LWPTITLAAVGNAYLDNATLVVGSVAADYAPLHPADDLARCLRYYEKVKATTRFNAVGAGAASFTPLPYKTTMAITPTITAGTPDSGPTNVSTQSAALQTADGAIFQVVAAAAGDCYWAGPYILEANP
jgi:hypothetical protein